KENRLELLSFYGGNWIQQRRFLENLQTHLDSPQKEQKSENVDPETEQLEEKPQAGAETSPISPTEEKSTRIEANETTAVEAELAAKADTEAEAEVAPGLAQESMNQSAPLPPDQEVKDMISGDPSQKPVTPSDIPSNTSADIPANTSADTSADS